ncbi:hypothetical protein Btru_052201 [Bulinus truncatus]|nr:hypothetical protein Btru_052201 [Bulinus truncatus]
MDIRNCCTGSIKRKVEQSRDSEKPLLEDFRASAASELSYALRTTVQVQQLDTTEETISYLIVAVTSSFLKLDIGKRKLQQTGSHHDLALRGEESHSGNFYDQLDIRDESGDEVLAQSKSTQVVSTEIEDIIITKYSFNIKKNVILFNQTFSVFAKKYHLQNKYKNYF